MLRAIGGMAVGRASSTVGLLMISALALSLGLEPFGPPLGLPQRTPAPLPPPTTPPPIHPNPPNYSQLPQR